MKKCMPFVLAAILVASLNGCGEGRGPLTLGNLFTNYPAKVLGVSMNIEASLVQVSFQPYDAQYVSINGWFFVPQDTSCVDRRHIEFTSTVLSGTDTRDGTALFVIASYDWPYGWSGNALTGGVSYYYMVKVQDPQGRTVVHVYKFLNGQCTVIARAICDDSIGNAAEVTTSDGRKVTLTGITMPDTTRGKSDGAAWLAEIQKRAG